MEKISDYPAATTMNDLDLLEKSETNFPSAGYTSKKITWANVVSQMGAALQTLLHWVIGDGGTSIQYNIAIFNSTDAQHIIDSGVPVPGVYKRNLIIGAAYNNVMAADIVIRDIAIKNTSGTPSIKIGTTLHGDEILPLSPITDKIFLPNVNFDTDATPTIYYEISSSDATSRARIRFDYTNKMFT
jgi:hypothetical protein